MRRRRYAWDGAGSAVKGRNKNTLAAVSRVRAGMRDLRAASGLRRLQASVAFESSKERL